MIKDIYDALVACKYDVSLIPQATRPDRKIVFRLSAFDIEVDDPNRYNTPIYVELEWNDTAVLEIPLFIKTLCEDVEKYLYAHKVLRRGSFRWDDVKIELKSGSMYNITLTAMYLEEINI